MALNISDLITDIQNVANNVTSANNALEYLQIVNAVQQFGNTLSVTYSNTASLPTANSSLEGFSAYVDSKGLYLCDGTQWYNIVNTAPPPPPAFGGTTYGYNSGGFYSNYFNIIDKFSLTSDGNAVDSGDLTSSRREAGGQSSLVSGYTSGGYNPAFPTSAVTNVIDKFPFASGGNATNVGNLSQSRRVGASQSSLDLGYGYNSGGGIGGSILTVIDKFAYASDGNATSSGTLITGRYVAAGSSSTTHGYTAGGSPGPLNTIEKFPFASDTPSSSVGNLTTGRFRLTGLSSADHGYAFGGQSDVNDKYPFASDTNATNVTGVYTHGAAGVSSTTNGYISGGIWTNTIQKFPFASNTPVSSVGNLTAARAWPAGQQI